MAQQSNNPDKQDAEPKLTPQAKHRRTVKEVTTKLKGLSRSAQAEVVNEVVSEQVSKQFGGFKDFLRDQSVIGIGIGLVLGTQLKTVVDDIMKHFVNPLTSLLPGQQTLSSRNISFTFRDNEAVIGWGAIAYSVLTFVIVAILIYVIYKILRLDKLAKKKD